MCFMQSADMLNSKLDIVVFTNEELKLSCSRADAPLKCLQTAHCVVKPPLYSAFVMRPNKFSPW